jgi:endonuclease/exonuclease/phosphatase family metal-dependent hydrolase
VRILTILAAAAIAGSGAAQEPKPRTLRVLSYNIHHGRGVDGKVDLPRLAKVIDGVKPDLVALQEVDHKTRRTGGVDQTAELAKLTGLHGKFGTAIDFEGGEYGQAILSRFRIGEVKVHMLPGEPEREQRIAFAAEIALEEKGSKLVFATTHLHHQNDEFRQKQAARIDEVFGMEPRMVFVAGDLNAPPDSKPLGVLAKNWKSADMGKPLLTFPVRKPARQIDYVLYRKTDRIRVVEVKVLDEALASDHRALLAVLELPD